jgi:CO/xanthine dehydrogenase Mo-binding subunit
MHFALESLLDMACNEIGLDPVEVRLKNCVRKGDVTLHGWNVRSCALDECIERVAKSIRKGHQPSGDPEGRYKRGIGVACMTHVSGNREGSKFDGSSALIRVHEDGNVFIYKGEADMGQGARTVFSQIAAETLGIPMEKIYVMPIDTDVSPYCLGSYSSRVSTVGGNAVKIAAEKVLDQLLDVAAEMSGASKESLQMEDGVISSTSDPKVSLTLEEVAFRAIRTQNGRPLTEYITYDPPTTGADSNYYGDYSSAYTYAAQGVEVEVDTHTGKVRVLRVVAAHDLGKVINEMGAKGQVTGGVAQGIGWALYENMVFDKGKPVCRDLHGYTLMTIADMPPVEIHLLETDDPIGPYGAKGIGEPTLIPTAPAIANAIENAVGVRITSLPMTPEKVYRAIREKEAKAKS